MKMPLYEFECPAGHITEKIFSIKDCPNIIDCSYKVDRKIQSVSGTNKSIVMDCLLPAEKIWSIPGNIQLGEPTKVFVNNKTGDVFTPATKSDRPPKGYHEKELKGPIERTKFEKEQQHRVNGRNQFMSHHLDLLKSEARKNRQDDTKARMNAIQREEVVNPQSGKTETIEYSLDHKEKALLKKAMERSAKKPMKEKKSEVKLAVNHSNTSNMADID
jgi:hypothetical protein